MTQETAVFTHTHWLIVIAAGLLAALSSPSLAQAVIVTGLVLLAIVGWVRGWWQRLARNIGPALVELWRAVSLRLRRSETDTADVAPYELRLGYSVETNEPESESLFSLRNMGVYGTSRYGKTTLLHGFIHWLIAHNDPSQLKIAISDPKTVDYTFYGGLPHLLCPIATDADETKRMVKLLVEEMNRRKRLFAQYSSRYVCNNLHRYAELSGTQLPLVLAIFDEIADVVQPGEELEADLIRIAKLGQAFGISMILATQRPSSGVMTGEIQSQLQTRFVTWMPNNREYGVVANVPKEVYSQMERRPGLFMAYSGGGWRLLQSRRVPDRKLEALARRMSRSPLRWEHAAAEAVDPAKPNWTLTGTYEQKVATAKEITRTIGHVPSLAELMELTGCSKPTAVKYRTVVVEEGYE